MILDGWGMTGDSSISAVAAANTPFMDSLPSQYPNATLRTSGMDVGLPDGQMGNSEVGHMNLGAGRVVYQDLVKLNLASEDGSLAKEPVLLEAMEYAKRKNKKFHLMGLVSDGGVHAHIRHLKALLSAASDFGLEKVFVHAFTDGRDTDPKSGVNYIVDLQDHLEKTTGSIASVIGRYYAMDRDKRWERVKKAYDLLVLGKGDSFDTAKEAIEQSYKEGITDEFINPRVIDPEGRIEAGDVVLCFNFRTDRGRQITMALTQEDFPEYNMSTLDLHYVTMTRYDEEFKGIHVIMEKDNLSDTMGEVLSQAGKTQLRIAETEKYPHVTFFFSGGREEKFPGEERIMCPSPKVATYDLQPEMSAYEVRDKVVAEINQNKFDFICINFANPDMVGHTGVFEAAVKACETVDICVKDVIDAALEHSYDTIIIADHGNAEVMKNPDGSPNTAHTTNPVPFILVSNHYKGKLEEGKLGDVAPTLMELMGLDQPEAMTGKSLLG